MQDGLKQRGPSLPLPPVKDGGPQAKELQVLMKQEFEGKKKIPHNLSPSQDTLVCCRKLRCDLEEKAR